MRQTDDGEADQARPDAEIHGEFDTKNRNSRSPASLAQTSSLADPYRGDPDEQVTHRFALEQDEDGTAGAMPVDSAAPIRRPAPSR